MGHLARATRVWFLGFPGLAFPRHLHTAPRGRDFLALPHPSEGPGWGLLGGIPHSTSQSDANSHTADNGPVMAENSEQQVGEGRRVELHGLLRHLQTQHLT